MLASPYCESATLEIKQLEAQPALNWYTVLRYNHFKQLTELNVLIHFRLKKQTRWQYSEQNFKEIKILSLSPHFIGRKHRLLLVRTPPTWRSRLDGLAVTSLSMYVRMDVHIINCNTLGVKTLLSLGVRLVESSFIFVRPLPSVLCQTSYFTPCYAPSLCFLSDFVCPSCSWSWKNTQVGQYRVFTFQGVPGDIMKRTNKISIIIY